MKVVMIALGTYGLTGGMEAFNRRVVQCIGSLVAEGRTSSHVVSLWDGPEQRACVPSGVGFFPGRRRKGHTAAHFLHHIAVEKPDVVVYGHVMLSPLAALVSILSPRSRQMLFVHGTEVWGDPAFRRVPAWEIAAVRLHIDQVVSVSRLTAARMAMAFRLPDSRFTLLQNAVDIPRTCSLGSHSNRERTGSVLLTVSRLGWQDRYKGIDKVIRALPEVIKAMPQVRYVVVGEGPLRGELEALAAKTGVADRVHFWGRVTDETLEDAYASSDVFLMPSTGEGFGIVFLEAWKHRLPVICGNSDASPEVVTDGYNGFTVDSNDGPGLVRAAVRLLTDRDLARAMGERGFQTVTEKHTQERFRATLENILGAGGRSNRQTMATSA